MSENVTEVIVGGVVLAAALGFVAYAGQVTGFATQGGTYDLRASFRSVQGVSVGTDVRLAGVKVGTITDLDLNPETFFADAVMTVDDRISVPEDSTVLISQDGLLGGSYVEIQPGGALDNIEPGGEFYDTQGSVSLITLLLRAFTSDGEAGAAGEDG